MNNKDKAAEVVKEKQAAAKVVRFKAGAELTDKVNKTNFVIDDYSDEKEFKIKVMVDFFNDEGEHITFHTGSKRPRFKASSDLTEKVNLQLNGKTMEIVLDKVDYQVKNATALKQYKTKNKTRFKAGADLTDKVNKIEIDYIEILKGEAVNVDIVIKTL